MEKNDIVISWEGEPYVFISYCYKDDNYDKDPNKCYVNNYQNGITGKNKVFEVVQTLWSQYNCPVWFDNKISGGDKFEKILRKKIKGAAKMIAFISKNYGSNQDPTKDACLKELKCASENNIEIIPVIIDDSDFEEANEIITKYSIDNEPLNCFNINESNFYEKLSKKLSDVIAKFSNDELRKEIKRIEEKSDKTHDDEMRLASFYNIDGNYYRKKWDESRTDKFFYEAEKSLDKAIKLAEPLLDGPVNDIIRFRALICLQSAYTKMAGLQFSAYEDERPGVFSAYNAMFYANKYIALHLRNFVLKEKHQKNPNLPYDPYFTYEGK